MLDLKEWGPTVIEAPPGSLCIVDDFWFRHVADMGAGLARTIAYEPRDPGAALALLGRHESAVRLLVTRWRRRWLSADEGHVCRPRAERRKSTGFLRAPVGSASGRSWKR